jgi:hypothetical protein
MLVVSCGSHYKSHHLQCPHGQLEVGDTCPLGPCSLPPALGAPASCRRTLGCMPLNRTLRGAGHSTTLAGTETPEQNVCSRLFLLG